MSEPKMCRICGVKPRSGKKVYCSSCSKNRKEAAATHGVTLRSYGKPDMTKRPLHYMTLKRYGVTLEEANRLRTERPCEVCGVRNQRKKDGTSGMVLDHTVEGSYHGVLCQRCNTLLGVLDSLPALTLERLMVYKTRTRSR